MLTNVNLKCSVTSSLIISDEMIILFYNIHLWQTLSIEITVLIREITHNKNRHFLNKNRLVFTGLLNMIWNVLHFDRVFVQNWND